MADTVTGDVVVADVVVLGGGSAGESVAREVAGWGGRPVLVEQRLVGGECPYLACMPSKALLRAAAARRDAARADRSGGGRFHPERSPAEAWADAVRRRDEVAEHRDDTDTARQLTRAGVRIVRGQGRVTGQGQLRVAGETLRWDRLVVCTGSAPNPPPVDGLPDVPWWTSDQALSDDTLPARLLVLGGGPVGCELAQVYARFGARVTLLEVADRLLPGEPQFTGAALTDSLRADGVDVRVGVRPERAEPAAGGLLLRLADGSVLTADRLLAATGREPRTADLGLELLGVRLAAGAPLPTDERCRVRGARQVWAAGDVTGTAPFTHTANYQAKVVAADLRGRPRSADYRALPRAVYTDPPVFAVGHTPESAARAGVSLRTAVADLAQTARAALEEGAAGRVELYADRDTDRLVGAAGVGPGVDEWLAEATLAVRAGVPVAVLADVVHAFPTFGEALEPAYRSLVETTGSGSGGED